MATSRHLLRVLAARIRAILAKDRDRDLHDEIQTHLDLLTAEYVRRGLSPDAAHAAARREFGGVEQVKEQYRDQRRWRLVDELVHDLRDASRTLRKDRAFALIAIATLSIGIAATSVAFTQLNAVLWKPLPVGSPDRVRVLSWTSPTLPNPSPWFSYDAYSTLRDGIGGVELACSWAGGNSLAAWGPIAFELVTGNFFEAVGIEPLLGRMIAIDDDQPGNARFVAVISTRLWRRVFRGDRSVLGSTLVVNGIPFQIVGVMPEGFAGLNPSEPRDVMLPYGAGSALGSVPHRDRQRDRSSWRACREVVAQIGPGVSDERLRAEGQGLLTQAMLVSPPLNGKGARLLVTPLRDSVGPSALRKQASPPLFLLIGAAGLILASTCANLAGLMYARGHARQKEVAARLAVGASRARIVRQLVTESLFVSVVGGCLGVGLAYAAGPWLPDLLGELAGRNWLNPALTPGVNLSPDRRVLLFAIAITLATGLIVGLLPALRTTRIELISMMKCVPRNGGRHRIKMGKTLVCVQVAFSMLLLVGAGLFVRTLLNLIAVPVGYTPDALAFVTVDPRGTSQTFIQDTLRRFEGLPGVAAATVSQWPIYNNAQPKFPVCPPRYGGGEYGMDIEPVAPGFFETWGVRLLIGREFTLADQHYAPAGERTFFEFGEAAARPSRVAIVNETFVKTFLGEQNAIGQEVGIGTCPGGRKTIVGVVADHLDRQREAITPMVYVPFPFPGLTPVVTFAVRTKADSKLLIDPMRRLAADAGAPVDGDVMTGAAYREREWRKERLLSGFLVVFGLTALAISCLGVYGILEYLVTLRTSELGIRMALGAPRSGIVRMVLGEPIVPVVSGMALGVTAAALVARWLASVLFGVTPLDLWTITAAASLLLLTALAAALIPARQASSIDPMSALRHE
jgi:predicted permease